MSDDAAVIVFAKAPTPGTVKTRLIPAIGQDQAALLHAALVERALVTATQTRAAVYLSCAPSADERFFCECAEDFEVELLEQGEGSLGTRMLNALNEGLQHYSAVAILGADCPAVSAKHVDAALTALHSHDVSIIPAEDGGYVLIAVRRTHAAMFDNIEWGGGLVMAQQRKALTAVGLSLHESTPLWDVDRPEDLARLKTLKPALAYSLPE